MANRQNDVRRGHIDTSLLVELSKEQRKADPVRKALGQFRFTSTSSYARKEFKASWLRDLGWLHEISRTAVDYADIFRKLNTRLQHPAQRRHVTRCFEAIIEFLDSKKQDASIAEETLTSAESILRFRCHVAEAILSAYIELDRSVTKEFDGTGCVRATERPTEESNGSIDVSVPRCQPSHLKCRIHKFFEEHREAFLAVAGEVDARLGSAATKEDFRRLEEWKRAVAVIRRAEVNSGSLGDDKACSAIGDALVAIDGYLHSDVFLANNDKEWALLAAILQRDLINPVINSHTPH